MMTGSVMLYKNNCIDIVHDACRLCYKSKGRDTNEGRLKYIEDKIKVGHESVIEHSNIVMMIIINMENVDMQRDLVEVMAAGKHLNYSVKNTSKYMYVVIGGNIRAYKNIYRNIKNGNNSVLKLISKRLYHTPKEFYYDFIESGIMNPRSFMDSEFYTSTNVENDISEDSGYDNKYYSIEGIDDIEQTMNKINLITGESGLFEYDDILDMHTVTVYFKRMSRIISQQVTRHRNPISQKSQRYVGEEEATFIHPNEFKDDIKDVFISKISDTDITRNMTLADASNVGLSIYGDMRKDGFLKEDARYYLPQNANTELYMTFTIRTLIHFIELRSGKGAQAEVKNIAEMLYKDITNVYGSILGTDLSVYLLPKYILSENKYRVEGAFI